MGAKRMAVTTSMMQLSFRAVWGVQIMASSKICNFGATANTRNTMPSRSKRTTLDIAIWHISPLARMLLWACTTVHL
eukprot:6492555-Amphidinium_carterae.2